jgi:hypothetical protein
MAGDMLILQESKCQAVGRYFIDVFRFDFFSDVISRRYGWHDWFVVP